MFRKHGRTAIRCPMLLKHKTWGVFEAVTRDISATGMFIVGSPLNSEKSDFPVVSVGDELIAQVDSAEDQKSENLLLKVARLDDEGFALTFV